jgi:hypothetical protein
MAEMSPIANHKLIPSRPVGWRHSAALHWNALLENRNPSLWQRPEAHLQSRITCCHVSSTATRSSSVSALTSSCDTSSSDDAARAPPAPAALSHRERAGVRVLRLHNFGLLGLERGGCVPLHVLLHVPALALLPRASAVRTSPIPAASPLTQHLTNAFPSRISPPPT